MNIFRRLTESVRTYRAKLNLQRAIRMAEEAHKNNGKRYYVMPSQNGKLIVMDRANFRKLRQKHYIPQDRKITDATEACFYFTANGAGETMSKELRQEKERKYRAFLSYKRRLGIKK